MIALLWTVVLFALYMAWPFMPSQTIRTVSLVAVVLVLLFNTASICTMITHYAEDEE